MHHQQHMGPVPQAAAAAPNAPILATTPATSSTQQILPNGEAVVSTATATDGQDPIYALNMVQSVAGGHDPLADQPTPVMMGQHHHHQLPTYSSIPYPSAPGMMHLGADQAHMVHHPHHPQMAGALQHYGYSTVAYYSQHGPVMTPWHYSNGPQYHLSEIFVYNGLAPYPSGPKSGNIKTNSSTISGSTTVSSASLLGAPPQPSTIESNLTYQSQHINQHQHYHNHRNNSQQSHRVQNNNHNNHYAHVQHNEPHSYKMNTTTSQSTPSNVPQVSHSQNQQHGMKDAKSNHKSNRNK